MVKGTDTAHESMVTCTESKSTTSLLTVRKNLLSDYVHLLPGLKRAAGAMDLKMTSHLPVKLFQGKYNPRQKMKSKKNRLDVLKYYVTEKSPSRHGLIQRERESNKYD